MVQYLHFRILNFPLIIEQTTVFISSIHWLRSIKSSLLCRHSFFWAKCWWIPSWSSPLDVAIKGEGFRKSCPHVTIDVKWCQMMSIWQWSSWLAWFGDPGYSHFKKAPYVLSIKVGCLSHQTILIKHCHQLHMLIHVSVPWLWFARKYSKKCWFDCLSTVDHLFIFTELMAKTHWHPNCYKFWIESPHTPRRAAKMNRSTKGP